jgi:hypothetical protein
MMRSLVCVAAAGCGGLDRFGTPSALDLPSTAGEFDIEATVLTNDCGSDRVRDTLASIQLKFDQVASGLSVFVDADMGWIPCDGSIDEFSCGWANAPSVTPGGSWAWRLAGTTEGDIVDATLTLTVTCDEAATDACVPCGAVQEITGTLL